MFKTYDRGKLQLILVGCFIIGSLLISKLLNSDYAPMARNGGQALVLPVSTTVATPEQYFHQFEINGVIEARHTVAMMPEVSGRVVQVTDNVYPGGMFEAQQTLFVIDPEHYKLVVAQAIAKLARTTATLDLEKAEMASAIRGWQQLHGTQTVPELVAREPQLARATADSKVAQFDLKRAQLDLKRTSFSLPFSGKVIQSMVTPGLYVSAGQAIGQVYDPASLEVRASVTAQQWQWLSTAHKPQVKIFYERPNETVTLDGTMVRSVVDLDPQTRYGAAYFTFNTTDHDILPGTFVRLSLQTDVSETVIKVPSSAVHPDGSMWRVMADSTLKKVQGTILHIGENEVMLSGIDETLEIVTSHISGAFDGMQVIQSEPTFKSEEEALA